MNTRFLTLTLLVSAAAFAQGGATPPKGTATTPAPIRIEVTVTDDGFVLGKVPPLKAGRPITLVVTRTVEQTCATDIVLKEFGLSVPLPLNKPVEVTFVPKKAGKVHFSCAMDMISGDLQVN